jgi:hypothetical protein
LSLVIVLKPTLSNVFERLKKRHDPNVYDTKDSAIPNFKEIEVSGSGANAGEFVTLYRNNEEVSKVRASSGGNFDVTVPILYENHNSYYAEGTSSGKSNTIAFNVYNWLLFHYLYSQEFLRIIQSLGQSKQDLYIDTEVGDSVAPTFETEKSSYDTSTKALKDKMTLPIPSDYWGQNIKQAIKKAIEISENGPVFGSLLDLVQCYQGVNVEKIFSYHMQNPLYWNLDVEHLPEVKGPAQRNILVIPAYTKCRLGWSLRFITIGKKEIVFAGATNEYWWVYVDGEKDVDDTLKVKYSKTQPVPGIYSKTLTYNENDVSTDDEEGSITGIPYQKYVTLVPPVACMTSSVSIEDDDGIYADAALVSREILALGRANTRGILSVTYEYYLESEILCVLYFDGIGNIDKIMRTWSMPNHIRTQELEQDEQALFFVKFSSEPANYQEVLSNIRDILMEIVPITLGYIPFVNLGKDDQEVIEEDTRYWPELYKGYCYLDYLLPEEKRERYTRTQANTIL